MIIVKKHFLPLIRVISPELNFYALQEAIEEYIHENSLPSHVNGQIKNVLHISGQAKQHHESLIRYFNVHPDIKNKFDLVEGYFMNEMVEHYWAQSKNIIVDLTIGQFKNFPYLDENPLINVSNYSYLICDNPDERVYQMYIQRYD